MPAVKVLQDIYVKRQTFFFSHCEEIPRFGSKRKKRFMKETENKPS